MDRIKLLPIVLGITGFIVLYGAIQNRNPIDVVRLAVQGEPISGAAPLDGSSGNNTAGPGAIPGDQIPGTPEADGDARTDGSFDSDRSDVIPRLPGESTPLPGGLSSQPVYYSRGNPYANSQYWV